MTVVRSSADSNRPGASLPAAAVELRHVTKRFGSVVAVDGVSLSVRRGEFLTLLGPSGCGKTTLLRLIAGFELPDSGFVLLGDEDVTTTPPYRRDVNQVFQSYALFPHLSVSDNIAFGLRMQRLGAVEIETRLAEAVSLVGLVGCENRKPHELSGGQRQRVALARALAPRPAVLLLDEPLSALDAQLRQATRLELKQLQRQLGTTFVLVTHDQEEALTLSDRIALINAGRIEQMGDAHTLYHHPATSFAAEFMGHANLIVAELVGTDDGHARVRLAGGLELRLPAASWPAHVSRAKISIRPERIAVSKAPTQGQNVFQARVDAANFRGPLDQFAITTTAGTRLTVVASNNAGSSYGIRVGDAVSCTVQPEDVILIPP